MTDKKIAEWFWDGLLVLGFCGLIYGFWIVSRPSALIVGSLVVIVVAYLVGYKKFDLGRRP